MALFDPDDLIRIAGRIDAQASALRARGRSLVAAAYRARWHSTAATAFRGQVEHLDRRIQHAGHNLERAADELRAHARRVRTAEAALAAAVRIERTTARETARLAGEAGHLPGHLAGAGVREAEHLGGWLDLT